MRIAPFLLALVAAPAVAAVAGTPAPVAPGAVPTAWLLFGNDDIGVEGTGSLDDNRTSQIALGTRFGEDVALCVDHSILTDCMNGTRADELTVTLGWLPWGSGKDDAAWAAFGGGIRSDGDILGRNLQNDVHNSQGFVTYDCAYDDSLTTAVAYACGEAPWWPLDWAGAEAQSSALVSSYGEIQADTVLRGVLRGPEARGWAGVRWNARIGDPQDRTARSVATFERGIWLDYGASWRGWVISGGSDVGNGHSYGMIGLVVTE